MEKEQDKARQRRSVDGWPRSAQQEQELNEWAVATFGRGAGARFLEYLKQITTAASGPEATDAELRHYAGQRHLVHIIDERVRAGHNQRRKS